MENETDKALSTILETESNEEEVVGELIPAEEEQLPAEVIPAAGTERDIEYDYEYSRITHRDLIEKGTDALDGILKVAKESQHPRAYEVAGNILKNLSDMTDKLMVLQEKKKSLKSEDEDKTPKSITVEKAVFVGSTSDLLKKVRQENSK